MSYVIAIPPFRTIRVGNIIREGYGVLRIPPRQSFSEVACLYQNDDGKATVISKA